MRIFSKELFTQIVQYIKLGFSTLILLNNNKCIHSKYNISRNHRHNANSKIFQFEYDSFHFSQRKQSISEYLKECEKRCVKAIRVANQ